MKLIWNIAARIAITIAAMALLFTLRPDLWGSFQRKVFAGAIENRSPQVIDEYMRAAKIRKLQIGSGGKQKPGWLNTDVEPILGEAYLDATKRFPLPDNSFSVVFSEHVIEHLDYEFGSVMLRESYRVLQSGGAVRIATPNLLQFLELFKQSPQSQRYIDLKLAWHNWPRTPDPANYILNREMHDFGHRFVYAPDLLAAQLKAAGFRDIKQVRPGESDDPELRNLETREQSNVAEANAYESMIFEARK